MKEKNIGEIMKKIRELLEGTDYLAFVSHKDTRFEEILKGIKGFR